MRMSRDRLWSALFPVARTVAAALLARFWPGHDHARAEARLAALSLRDQTLIVLGVLALLFLCAVLAAQWGLVGMAVYFLAVILIVN